MRSGFDSNTFARNDDDSIGASIGFGIDFFGLETDQLYINNNGNVTFDQSLSTYTPFDLNSTSRSMIAPFFADVDTRGPGEAVTYGGGTVDDRRAFGINWENVGFYSYGDRFNSFQLVMVDRSDIGVGDFDFEFNYDRIQWEAGEASGSNSQGLGGNSARVGYSNGTDTFFELPGSAVNGAFLDLGPLALVENSLNSDVQGRYVFRVRNGVVLPPTPVPEPASVLGLLAVGALGVTSLKRKQKKDN